MLTFHLNLKQSSTAKDGRGISIQFHAPSRCSNCASNFDSNAVACFFAFDPFLIIHALSWTARTRRGDVQLGERRLQWEFKCTLEIWLKCARALIWIQWTTFRVSLCCEFNTQHTGSCSCFSGVKWSEAGGGVAGENFSVNIFRILQLTDHSTLVWVFQAP